MNELAKNDLNSLAIFSDVDLNFHIIFLMFCLGLHESVFNCFSRFKCNCKRRNEMNFMMKINATHRVYVVDGQQQN